MNQYITLFKEICTSAEVLAERVMELDRQNNDNEGLQVAEQMREDYIKLGDKIKDEAFTLEQLNKQDYLKILAASYMITNNMLDKITALKKTVDYYKTYLNPRLERVVDESTDEVAPELVSELFKEEM